MKKVFIDCGYHLGEGLREFTNILNIDTAWDIYAFEANPHCEIEKKVKNHPFKVSVFNKAVWIHDNGVVFNQENNKASNSPVNGSTSHLDGWGSCISDLQSVHTFENQVKVESIDFAVWIEQFKDNEIFCKMDIEGAEFSVLRRLIELKSISRIKEIWVEWHDVDLPDEDINTRTSLIHEISKFCKINSWK